MPSKIKTNVAYGRYPALINLANEPIIANRAPISLITSHDKYEIGQEWIDTVTNLVYVLTSYAAGAPIWTLLGSGAGTGIVFAPSGAAAVTPAINTANYLTLAGNVTVTLPAVAPVGSVVWIIDNAATAPGFGFVIQAPAGVTIHASNRVTAPGGTATYQNGGTAPLSIAVQLMATVANTDWTIVSETYPGNLV